MSGLVCYIERAERGMLPVRLRLLSSRSEEAWSFPTIAPDDRAALERGLREAAAWIAERVGALGKGGLGAIVLDVDGSMCSWVSTLSADADAIGAMLRHAGSPTNEEDGSHMIGSPPHLSLSADVQAPGGACVQPLGAEGDEASGPQVRRRLGVLVVPDATVRLLLDALDSAGIEVGRTVTIWHAISEAFDTGGAGSRAERVVVEASATTAQVLVDPVSGRLVWSWSRAGTPVAAGAFRLARPSGESERVAFEGADLARLASEWIAWSTQLGASPSRVRLVIPEGSWVSEASLGERVAAVWPGATADITLEADPLGLALTRFADGVDDARGGGGSLATLQARPGRQHRAMYRWSAGAIAVASAVMGVASFVVHRSGADARLKADQARREWRQTAGELFPAVNDGMMGQPNFDSRAMLDLRTELERRRKERAPVEATPEKPILAELETLSFVLGNPDYRLERLDLSSNAVIIDVIVPNTAAYEELVESLGRIAGSSIGSWERNPRPVTGRESGGTEIRAQFTGLWAVPSRPAGSRGTS